MFFKGIFSRKDNKVNNVVVDVGGDIKRYELEDWWMNSLTEEERGIIRNIYKPMSTSSEEYFIDKGPVHETTSKKSKFMGTLATWFLKPEYYEMCKKILIESDKFIDNETDVLDKHFYYASCMKVYYRCREVEEDALNQAILYAENQISLSKQVKKAFLKEYPKDDLPSHAGYKQLAIIYEKQKEYDKAIKLSERALAEGWNGDWSNRIERLKKKLK